MTQSTARLWKTVACANPSGAPSARVNHTSCVYQDSFYLFGGRLRYDDTNEMHKFDLKREFWCKMHPSGVPPSPRDQHTAVVYQHYMYIFGGTNMSTLYNDLFKYNFLDNTWEAVDANAGLPPSPRLGHVAVVHGDSMYCFGGYDGSTKNDLHQFDFVTSTWTEIRAQGEVPKPRDGSSLVVRNDACILFGGHDGLTHLDDVHVYNIAQRHWSRLAPKGPAPIPRQNHVAVAHINSMYIFGGGTPDSMSDFYELNLGSCRWRPVLCGGERPSRRQFHAGCVYRSRFLMFGGRNELDLLDDFKTFQFEDESWFEAPRTTISTTITEHLRALVDKEILSDITFIVDETRVHAHKLLCIRCPYFTAMLTGAMVESRSREIIIQDTRRPIFLLLLEYLYCDDIEIPSEDAVELLVAAGKFGVDGLKRMCEIKVLSDVNVENVATVLRRADFYNAEFLRNQCFQFMLDNHDVVTKTEAFKEMTLSAEELVLELRRRHSQE